MGTVQGWRVPLCGQDNLGSSLGEAVHTATESDPEPGPPPAFPGTSKHQVIGEGVHWTPCWGLLGSDPVSVPPFLHLQDEDSNVSACLWLSVSPPQPHFLHLSNKGFAPPDLRSLHRADVLVRHTLQFCCPWSRDLALTLGSSIL